VIAKDIEEVTYRGTEHNDERENAGGHTLCEEGLVRAVIRVLELIDHYRSFGEKRCRLGVLRGFRGVAAFGERNASWSKGTRNIGGRGHL